MCCFSPIAAPAHWIERLFRASPGVRVAETRIFGRVDAGIQSLAYSLSITTPADVAMVLPLPVLPGSGESALCFVDLSGYSKFFADVDALVAPPLLMPAAKRGGFSFGVTPKPRLIVHDVGAFEASFVPSIADFDRLDARFRLPEQLWDARPEYRDFGFAVFKLKKGKKQSIHTMAMQFPAREPATVFFPTLHVHDGTLRARASFDHELYYQAPGGAEPRRERPEAGPAGLRGPLVRTSSRGRADRARARSGRSGPAHPSLDVARNARQLRHARAPDGLNEPRDTAPARQKNQLARAMRFFAGAFLWVTTSCTKPSFFAGRLAI